MAEKTTTTKSSTKTTFETLAAVNVSEHLEKKPAGGQDGLNYLSWTWAIDYVSRFDPTWKFRVIEFDSLGVEMPEDQHGFQYQKVLGGSYMVHTEVTIKGETKRMWLPIMDSHNAAMKDEPYVVTVKTRNGQYNYTVPAVDAMALNKTIMRCLVKNFALFGLGLYVFSGEDLPLEVPDAVNLTVTKEATKADETPKAADPAVKVETPAPEMSLDKALEQVISSGSPKFHGKKMRELNQAFLALYADNSPVKLDREAAIVILNAIKAGQYTPAA